ncbi:cob(I)yrinic acid a,c-diamide adenosyltransferase [Patescibacteria group bacterium]|nr:cob(I)yrinic acid a,c-diamide adenosyltransferase [Patescibacteria group bacterium]
MSKIYTKTGDRGETSLYGGLRVPKGNLRLEAYGTVDETNAALGVVLAEDGANDYQAVLLNIQKDLFTLASELATPPDKTIEGLVLVNEDKILYLEEQIDKMEKELPTLQQFIFPGGSKVAASLHLARTVCRRAERQVVRLREMEEVREEVVKYLNRLSDFLFVLARLANKQAGQTDKVWQGRS